MFEKGNSIDEILRCERVIKGVPLVTYRIGSVNGASMDAEAGTTGVKRENSRLFFKLKGELQNFDVDFYKDSEDGLFEFELEMQGEKEVQIFIDTMETAIQVLKEQQK